MYADTLHSPEDLDIDRLTMDDTMTLERGEVKELIRNDRVKQTPSHRRPLIMADFEGHTHQEIAAELELSRSGATSRIRRARATLRERLRHCCEVEFGPDGRAVAFRRREEPCETCNS